MDRTCLKYRILYLDFIFGLYIWIVASDDESDLDEIEGPSSFMKDSAPKYVSRKSDL